MEAIHQNQQEIFEAISKLVTNIRKDSADRKSADYFKRRLETLESYWADYQYNHDRLVTEESRTHPYFMKGDYEQAFDTYKSTKTFIIEQHQAFIKKSLEPAPPVIPEKSQRVSYQGETGKGGQTEQMSKIEDNQRTSPVRVATGSSSKLDEMMKRQASNFRAFLRTVSGINVNVICQKWELEDALRTLQSRWSIVDSLHLELDSELEGTDETYERSYTKHEITYNELKREINSKLWSVSHRENSTPKMDIPVFNGNYQNWVSFKDLFTEAIHSNISLSSAQKMQFLKSKLRGEAERLIQHLQISSENYHVAWEILNHRYNNIRLIFTSHANTLLSLPTAQQPSVNHIKKIHDTTQECLNAIKNLGVDTSGWDPLIVHILLQKLDTESHNQYLESLKNPRDIPNLQEFLTFLENKFTTLESSRKKQENFKTSNNVTPNPNNLKTSKPFNSYPKQSLPAHKGSQALRNNSVKTCPLCEDQHGLYFCNKFLSMSPQVKCKTITKLNLCENCLKGHKGKDCISETRCRECQGKHNTLIHEAFKNTLCNMTIDDTKPMNENSILQQDNITEILLATAMIKVQARDGSYHKMRVLIDQGSQVSLISEGAAQILALPRKRCQGVISGIGAKESSCKGVSEISCLSLIGDFSFKTEVFIMNTLIKNLPSCTFSKPSWSHLDGIQLSDPDFNVSRPIDILLGADVYSHIIMDGISRSDQAVPIAQQTRLGWILCGNVRTLHCNVVLNQVDDLQRFWEIEDISDSSTLSEEDTQCVEYYKSTTTRRHDGSYEVRIPLKENFEKQLGASKHTAIAQFRQMERKNQHNKTIEQQYKSFINEYIALGHMKLSTTEHETEYYLPHHCVLRNDSTTTSCRVVFDGSRRTTSGRSLNDLMQKGPNLQQDLQSLLLRWRQYQYAFTADIEKMFRCIWVHEDDQCLQKIIWRDSADSALKEYQLCTVTQGTKAAPFQAMMTLKTLAEDERMNYKEAAQVLEQSFYMDDVLHGSNSVDSAIQLQQDLINLLRSGGFNLRKWRSNLPELLQTESGDNKEDDFDFKQPESTKTLGLRWNPKQDLFTFQSQMEIITKTVTKRSMLSDISKHFDPLGWWTPVSTRLKLLFQKVWMSNIGWDDQLPEDLAKEWVNIREDMSKLKQLELPRWLGTSDEYDQVELHGFSDSSLKAYACVIFCKIKSKNGDVKISLVAGKSRLVPASKVISLPKLELSGALLLAKLMSKVQECLNNYSFQTYGWVDSMVVLAWLKGDPSRWKPFVANRVRKICEIMPPNNWNHLKSSDNSADCASRGMSVEQLKNHSLWWNGPSWLENYDSKQANHLETFTTDEEAKKAKQVLKHVNYTQMQNSKDSVIEELLTRHSSFQKLTRVLAWILRFIKQSKQKQRGHGTYITLQEINTAKCTIIKYVQQTEFTVEIDKLQSNKPLGSSCKLLQFNPFQDRDGLLRVGGRLSKANINPDMMHPIILPHSGRLTELVIDHAHKLTLHGGARVTLAAIRQKYWIIGGNRAVKKRLHNCVTCRKQNPNKMTQLMGDLPSQRCNKAKPFFHTGVDFTGHVMIKANKGRGIKTTKGYIAVFVCMVTKLVHLELVSDLTSSAFLSALRRMAARKGTPRHLYSDNGTNFVATSRILKQEYENILQTFDQDFITEITNMEIEWHFNAPSWPSGGGLWESCVKSLKVHTRRVIGDQRLTFEEYSTVLAQVEAILNSRPLCPLTEDTNDLDFLTPSSFININQDLNILETETDMRTRWHLTQKIVQDIWKRWRSEYLSQLTARSKWRNQQPNIKINDVVTINDANLPPGKWAVGRVVELHSGSDGCVRVVTLKTKNGLIKRPIVKLSVLPVHNQQDDQSSSKISHDKTNNQKTRSSYSFMTLTTLLLFFMSILSTGSCNYSVTQIKDSQGLYFDKISDMRLIRDEWKIVSYYDMDPYWQGTAACNNYLNYLDKLCSKIKDNSHCNIITLQLRHEYSELEYNNHLLLSQHSTTRRDKRRRRGLINGVGYLANSLFGVLDDKFAEQYKQDIQLLRDNDNHLASLIKNQTSLIEVEYNILKRTEDSINKQHKMLNQLSNRIDNFENAWKKEAEDSVMRNEFSLGAIATTNMLRQLGTIQTTLLDTIMDVYHGKFNFHLLSPDQLKETLTTISSHLTKDLSLPINNLHTEITNIYRLLKVKARMCKEFLIFELRLPLLTRDSYEIMKILSVPQAIGNSSMARVIPIAKYVAINLRKESYIIMSTRDIDSCEDDGTNLHMCYIPRPIYHLKQDENLCQIEQNTGKCAISITSCLSEWTETSRINEYFYFCCGTCHIRVLCEHQAIAGRIEKAGIIHIEGGCLIKTDNFTVHSHNEGLSNLRIRTNFYTQDIEPINHVINISIPGAVTQNYSVSSHDTELEKLKIQIEKLKASENLAQQVSYHDIHHYTAIYVVLGITLLIGAGIVVRRVRSKRAARQAAARVAQARPLPAADERRAPHTSPPSPVSVTRIYSVCARVRDQCEPSTSKDSDVPKVDKCLTPMPRKTIFP